MEPVRIERVTVAHPEHRLRQDEAARAVAGESGEARRVLALARGTAIDERRLALPPDELVNLGGSGSRNDLYRQLAPPLALEAARAALGEADPSDVACLVTTSCTGYTVPSWGVGLAQRCGLPTDAMRLPITEAGCAGGAVALARAAEHLQGRDCQAALVAAVELCSLAFQPGGDDGNLTSKLIFGDGAGAALLSRRTAPGVAIVDTASALVPGTEDALGFALTDHGFSPILTRALADTLTAPTSDAVRRLLERNSLTLADVDAWLLHPGGPRILLALERALGIDRAQTRWSWDSMREFGNTSSAAIFDVIRRYLDDLVPGGHAVVAAFGPGLSIELLLLRAT